MKAALPLAVLCIAASFPCLQAQSPASSLALNSPDGRLQAQFATVRGSQPTTESGMLVYSVTFNGKPVVEQSALSLDVAGQPPLGSNVRLVQAASSHGEDDYALLAGKTSHVHDPYNSASLTLSETGGLQRTLIVEARAYNDAIAFRYVIPEQKSVGGGTDASGQLRLKGESTRFNIGKDASIWALELPNFGSAYEADFVPTHISALSQQGGVPSHLLVGLPLLMHIPGVAWAAITEADLEGNGAMYLTSPSDSGSTGFPLLSELAPRMDDSGVALIATLPHHSAWRVLLVGDEPGRLVESNVIEDLNTPDAIQDTSWIHPGKAAWNWWNGNIGADGKPAVLSTDLMRYYVDFAAQSGFPYLLVDAGWSAFSDITTPTKVDIPALVQYAAGKGVKIWIWTHYKPTAEQMDRAFPLYEKWGVAGVKTDFIQRDDQEGIEFYYREARLAAKYHLMVDFHGATKPWGIDRTYPNVLGYEAVMGMENSKWSARITPAHHTVLAFTRMLAGTMDYTPGAFRNATEAGFIARDVNPMVMGTRAQQLALYVAYFVPIQMVSDSPVAYANQPEFQFIRDVPAAWDETRVLAGTPGESITIARRNGNDWFLGSLTNWTPRDLQIPLDFLGNGQYTAQIYRDAADADQEPQHVQIENRVVRQHDVLTVHLAPGGGCAIRFVPKD